MWMMLKVNKKGWNHPLKWKFPWGDRYKLSTWKHWVIYRSLRPTAKGDSIRKSSMAKKDILLKTTVRNRDTRSLLLLWQVVSFSTKGSNEGEFWTILIKRDELRYTLEQLIKSRQHLVKHMLWRRTPWVYCTLCHQGHLWNTPCQDRQGWTGDPRPNVTLEILTYCGEPYQTSYYVITCVINHRNHRLTECQAFSQVVPNPQASVAPPPPPLCSQGGDTHACRRGGGGCQFGRRERHSGTLSIV